MPKADYTKATTAELRELLNVNAQTTQAAVKIQNAKERKARLAELRSQRNAITVELNKR